MSVTRRTHMFALATALAVLCALAFATPALASTRPTLKITRTCVRQGTRVRLILAVPASLLPTSAGDTSHRPVTADLIGYRLRGGVWLRTFTSRIATDLLGPTIAKYARPGRGRYRYIVRITGATHATTLSNAVQLAVVGQKVVALTFDDGPWRNSTESILGTLKRKDVRATFFMCGYALNQYRSIGRDVVKGGQEVGNHTYTHANLARLSNAGIVSELTRTQRLIKKLLGVTPRWCRPPYGSTSSRVKSVIASQGLKQVIWNVDPLDWTSPGASTVEARVVSRTRPGYVVLMHDGGGNRMGTAAAVPHIIDRLRSMGYDFVTMSELGQLQTVR
jgi:peptidoglycan/xylan/chitin deacetylase (PgdA/CDA1 family)